MEIPNELQNEFEQQIQKLEEIAESELNDELAKKAEVIADEMIQKTSHKQRYFKRIL